MGSTAASNLTDNILNFDIDKYLNPFIPANPLHHFPKVVSYPLGYRTAKPKQPPTVASWGITVVATVAALCLVGGILNYAPGIKQYYPPAIIASLGASAVLNYNTITSPLSQPRNTIVGHTLSAIVGVGIARLFQLNPDFKNIEWVSGAVACACASFVMSITNTLHPPGGATAVLASTQSQIIALGWIFPPMILLSSVLMTTVACIFNNLLRQYPVYWWTPDECGQKLHMHSTENEDVEAGVQEKSEENGLHLSTTTGSERTLTRNSTGNAVDGSNEIRIGPLGLQLPSSLEVSSREMEMLERLQERLVKIAN